MTKTFSSNLRKHVTQNGTTTEQHIAFIKTINIKRIPIYEFTLQRFTYMYIRVKNVSTLIPNKFTSNKLIPIYLYYCSVTNIAL